MKTAHEGLGARVQRAKVTRGFDVKALTRYRLLLGPQYFSEPPAYDKHAKQGPTRSRQLWLLLQMLAAASRPRLSPSASSIARLTKPTNLHRASNMPSMLDLPTASST